MQTRHSKDATSAKSGMQYPDTEEQRVVGFDPALYERWKPKVSKSQVSTLETLKLEASRVGNYLESIPLFVRRVPCEITKAEAFLFLNRLTKANLELARILTDEDEKQHDSAHEAEPLKNEVVRFNP